MTARRGIDRACGHGRFLHVACGACCDLIERRLDLRDADVAKRMRRTRGKQKAVNL